MKFLGNTRAGTRTADCEQTLPARTNVKVGPIAANHHEALAT